MFSASGFEIDLEPAEQYVRSGEVTFATISEAAMRRSEVARGYRLAKRAKEPGFGVFVNPNKRTTVELGAGDRVSVLAEDQSQCRSDHVDLDVNRSGQRPCLTGFETKALALRPEVQVR